MQIKGADVTEDLDETKYFNLRVNRVEDKLIMFIRNEMMIISKGDAMYNAISKLEERPDLVKCNIKGNNYKIPKSLLRIIVELSDDVLKMQAFINHSDN